MHLLPAEAIEGKCEVRKKSDIPTCSAAATFDHIFFCEHLYDPSRGSLKQVTGLLNIFNQLVEKS